MTIVIEAIHTVQRLKFLSCTAQTHHIYKVVHYTFISGSNTNTTNQYFIHQCPQLPTNPLTYLFSSASTNKITFFVCLVWGPHMETLRGYSLLCTQTLFLAGQGTKRNARYQSNPDWLCGRQINAIPAVLLFQSHKITSYLLLSKMASGIIKK